VAAARDLADDLTLWARRVPARLDRAARTAPVGEVQVLGLYSESYGGLMERAVDELSRSRHDVRFALGALDAPSRALASKTLGEGMRGAGKFENLNALLREAGPSTAEWIIVLDDDVELPSRFLDRFLVLAERFGLQLAQPAIRRDSHAAWAVCRRERGTILRETRLVEIGPVTAFHRSVAPALLPFPALRMGWGLDLHWGALARERGWRLGVVDAVPVGHRARETASGYDREAAVEELRGFLAGRPHIDRREALTVLERHRDLP
jgi:hypothetical protein